MAAFPNLPTILYDDAAGIQTIKGLIEHNNINAKYCSHRETLLHWAARRNFPNIVRYLIDSGALVNELDRYGGTPLFDAINSGNMDMVKYLLENGANVEYRNRSHQTVSEYACAKGYYDIADYIDRFEYVLPIKGVHCDDRG